MPVIDPPAPTVESSHADAAPAVSSAHRRRWWVVALLFVATTINYLDRQTLSVLGPTLRTQLHLTDHDYANAVSAFLFSYAIMYSLTGRWIDFIGVRLGMVACVAWWSAATMLTSVVRTAAGLIGVRFLLGIGEPGVFPGGMKACAELFEPEKRALPVGIFSSGISIGAVLAPPIIVFLALHAGWRPAVLLPGMIGLLWIPLWVAVYRNPPRQNDATVRAARRPWREVLAQPKVWGLLLARFASDPVWYFYLFWLPDYLQRERGMSLAQIGLFGWIPYLFADIGNVCGGWLTDRLIHRGWTPARARCAALTCVAILAPFGVLVNYATGPGQVIAVACVIACLCQVWATNTATLAADLSEPDERATVLGMMGTMGSLGGIAFSQLLAVLVAWKGYGSAFAAASVLHPIGVVFLLIFLRSQLSRKTSEVIE